MKSGAVEVGIRLTKHVSASYSRAGQATQYTAGDIIANSQTAASVTPIAFELLRPCGRIMGARMAVAPASGNLVIANMDIDLLLFRPATSIPFAAAGYPKDNDPVGLTKAKCDELLGVLSFLEGGWRNQLGALTAGEFGWQRIFPTAPIPFNIEGLGTLTLPAIMQAADIWNPGNVVQTFGFALEVEYD